MKRMFFNSMQTTRVADVIIISWGLCFCCCSSSTSTVGCGWQHLGWKIFSYSRVLNRNSHFENCLMDSLHSSWCVRNGVHPLKSLSWGIRHELLAVFTFYVWLVKFSTVIHVPTKVCWNWLSVYHLVFFKEGFLLSFLCVSRLYFLRLNW